MKKILLVFSLSSLLISCGQDKKARISGSFSGLDNDTVVLEMITAQQRTFVDTSVTNRKGDYSFRVKLPVAAPTFFNIHCNGSVIPLIVSPGEKVTVNSLCDLARNYIVEGSEDSRLLQEFNTFYNGGIEKLDSLSKLFAAAQGAPGSDSLRRDLLDQYTQEYYRIKREHISYVISHASSMAALYALYQRLPNDPDLFNAKNDLIYYRIVADSMEAHYPASPHVIALRKEVGKREEAQQLLSRINDRTESPLEYPEIVLEDMYGKKQKLSELNGRVILVDFWSVKDPNAAVRNAELKDLYGQLAGKDFSIFQVSLGDEKLEWVDAVQQQKLPWVSVFDPRGSAGLAAMSYNVSSVPSNVLIGRDGHIAGRNIFGDRLKAKLTELTR